MTINIEEAKTVIRLIKGDVFDSHEFIRGYIYNFPDSYAECLKKYKTVALAHAAISNFIRYNAIDLHIEKLDTQKTYGILAHKGKNRQWKKLPE